MTRHLLAAILFLALSVLTFVQFRLLLAGVQLEKQRFDQRTEATLLAVADSLNQPSPRTEALIQRLIIGQTTNDTNFVHPISDSLDALLKRELRRNGITASFAFAITPVYNGQILLADRAYKPGKFEFGPYQVALGNHIIGNCHFEPVLHFDVPDLFSYLLGELRGLLVPSAICLVAILACFLLLLNILRKEQRLNAIKNDFINNLTHELKTPAFSISLSSKMAKESLGKSDLQRTAGFLQLIENENQKIKTHVEKVLELASLESPTYRLNKTKVSIHQLLQDIAEGFRAEIESRGGDLRLDLLAHPDTASVDVAHLKNAVQNLVENGLKYTLGKPEIQVVTAHEGKHLLISVRDNGPGIDPVHQQKIFEKFYRIPQEGSSMKGFGLGLSYVMQIAKAHGGTVRVESGNGYGAKFTIVLLIQ